MVYCLLVFFVDIGPPGLAYHVVRETRGGSGCGTQLESVQIINNVSGDQGGGVYAYLSSNMSWDSVLVRGNTSASAGGGISVSSSQLDLAHVRVDDNTAGGDGGGILAQNVEVGSEWTNLIVAGDGAGDPADSDDSSRGGGISIDDTLTGGSTGPDITNATIVGNWSTGAGAGITFQGGATSELANVTVTHNTTLYGTEAIAGFKTDNMDGFLPVVLESTCNFALNSGTHPTNNDFEPELGWDDVLQVDPGFLIFAPSLDPTLWDFRIGLSSPLVDAGSGVDPRAAPTPADIGAYGGLHGDAWNLDGDNYNEWRGPGPRPAGAGYDCDDPDATVYPGSGCP